MIDYVTFCQIHDDRRQGLTVNQIASARGLHRHTVSRWLAELQFRPRQAPRQSPRPSKLDPFKPEIVRWIQLHRLSGQQVLQRLRELGYTGGYSILTDYLRQVRPPQPRAFLRLTFAPGECAQVDWGSAGTLAVGSTTRRLSFFVMVLCYSRLMYLEFTLSQSLEQFLSCHENAFRAFAGVPRSVMIDNLKSAVLERPREGPARFHPRYQELAAHFGFTIKPCGVRKPHEKGRVENGVGYVKKNFLNGRELGPFASINPAARHWLDTVANVRHHRETHQRPCDRFRDEQAQLLALPTQPFDSALIQPVRASSQCRVAFEANRYSVPAPYAAARLTLKVYPERVCLYHAEQLVARHLRCYDRHHDIVDPDHDRVLLTTRRQAREQLLLARFLALSPQAEAYYQQLCQRRLNPTHHVHKILALGEQHGSAAVGRALHDALAFEAYSSEYIANLLERRARQPPAPAPLHVPRAGDALELEFPEPDLSIYEPRPESHR
jgi:transposase